MIGEGKFQTEISRAWAVLESLKLGAYQNPKPAQDPTTVKTIRASTTYRDEYNSYTTLQAYDFLLDDGSLFFFRRDPTASTQLSYGYMESPYDVVPYSDFLEQFFGTAPDGSLDAWEEYEEHRAQAALRQHVVPIRYDWSPALYREGVHPVGHLHVGFRTEIRVAVDAILTPAHFVLFVLRQYYPLRWEADALPLGDVVRIAESLKAERVERRYCTGKDLLELRLSAFVAR
jgi:hypothetical protein